MRLVVGGPKGRGVDRVVRAQGHEQLFSTSFASAAERRSVMLIVTSGRAAGVAYTVAYRSV